MTTTILPTRNDRLGLLRHHRPHRDQPRRRPDRGLGDRRPPHRRGDRSLARGGARLPRLPPRPPLRRRRRERPLHGRAARSRDRRRHRPLDGLADRPPDLPRRGHPAPGFPTSPAGSPTSRSSTRCRPDPPPFATSAAHLRGCAARGRSRARDGPGPSQRRDDPMTKLSDTQAILLSAAAQRADGNLLPLPGSLRGGAATKVVAALLARGLAREEVTDLQTRADAALNTVWRNEPDGRARPPAHHPGGARSHRHRTRRRACGGADGRPRRIPVQRRHQLGRRAGGWPGGGRGAGRGPEEARPAEEGGCPHRARAPRPHRARPATTPSRRS